MNSSERRWLEVHQVASRLKVGTDTIYRWIRDRGLPALRVERRVKPGARRKYLTRIPSDGLERWLRANIS